MTVDEYNNIGILLEHGIIYNAIGHWSRNCVPARLNFLSTDSAEIYNNIISMVNLISRGGGMKTCTFATASKIKRMAIQTSKSLDAQVCRTLYHRDASIYVSCFRLEGSSVVL
mgnify:CR=1 FL=1